MLTQDDKPEASPELAAATRSPAPAGAFQSIVTALSVRVSQLFAWLHRQGVFRAPPSQAGQKRTSDELALDRTVMAAHRTLMAADRTLMAWVRTGLSMASFGFTIYKILQGFEQSGVTLGAAAQPRVVALFLIGLGNISIMLGSIEYLHTAQGLSIHGDIPVWRPSFVMAVLVAILSAALFVAVIFRAL